MIMNQLEADPSRGLILRGILRSYLQIPERQHRVGRLGLVRQLFRLHTPTNNGVSRYQAKCLAISNERQTALTQRNTTR